MKTRILTGVLAACLAGLVTAVWLGAATAGTGTFQNTTAMTIPDYGAATVYPSQITVSGLAGTITDIDATITGFSHAGPTGVRVLLVGPSGQFTELMSSVGGYVAVNDVDIGFDDAAASSLPQYTKLVSGIYKPTSYWNDLWFPPPAPAGPYPTSLSVFNDTDANGTWSLYVFDSAGEYGGSISGGWSLQITTESAGAEQAILDLKGTVSGMGLPHGLITALNSKLDEALTYLAADDIAGARGSIQAFLNQVRAQTGKKLTTEQAAQLTTAAEDILAILSESPPSPPSPCTAGSENFSTYTWLSQPATFAGGTIDTTYGTAGGVTIQPTSFDGAFPADTHVLFSGINVNSFQLTFTNAVHSVQLDAESNYFTTSSNVTLTAYDASNTVVATDSALQPAGIRTVSTLSVTSSSNNIKYFTIATDDAKVYGIGFTNIAWGCN